MNGQFTGATCGCLRQVKSVLGGGDRTAAGGTVTVTAAVDWSVAERATGARAATRVDGELLTGCRSSSVQCDLVGDSGRASADAGPALLSDRSSPRASTG
jgi:hypothetical protein